MASQHELITLPLVAGPMQKYNSKDDFKSPASTPKRQLSSQDSSKSPKHAVVLGKRKESALTKVKIQTINSESEKSV
jgi:hypothetical protein